MADLQHVTFPGKIVIIGFGSIGQGVLPLLLRHIGIPPARIVIVTKDDWGQGEAAQYGVRFVQQALHRGNVEEVLSPLLDSGDVLLNLSVDVSSLALVAIAWSRGALYLDTCIEPWAGGYTDPSQPPSERSNYALRERALAVGAASPGAPTAVITHGANPGLISHLAKQALLDVAEATGLDTRTPDDRAGWANLARATGVRVIHVAERDTQVALQPKQPGEFVNTWSVNGFVGEGCQPAELGWGTHERELPPDGHRHAFGSQAAIYLMAPGAGTRVRTWTPLAGPIHGFLITHSESVSLASYLTVGDPAAPDYRPTVHYAYHPCDDAVLSLHELAGRNWRVQPRDRILIDEIVSGIDELGILLMGHGRTSYWYGSQLSIEEARRLAPFNNATSLQVTCAVMAGLVWAIENPRRGMVEPEQLDFQRVLAICRPYLGPLVGVFSDWTPLEDRGLLFPEAVDRSDPWQFRNFRVT